MKWYLDFGHWGKDSGAVGTYNTKESDVVLKIGMIIKENLEKHNQQVITTRQDDKYYSLDYRSKKANENKCDYFVSIHMNAATSYTFCADASGLTDENVLLLTFVLPSTIPKSSFILRLYGFCISLTTI